MAVRYLSCFISTYNDVRAKSLSFAGRATLAVGKGKCKDDEVCYYFTVVYLKGYRKLRYAEAMPSLNH